MNVILSFGILLGIGYKNFAIEIADAEWSIPSRKFGVDEAVGSHLMKTFIEGVDVARMKICRIQEIMTIGFAECCTFVNGAVHSAVCSVIHGDNSMRRIQRRVPTRDGTVFTYKNEKGGGCVPIFCHLEKRCAVEYLCSGIDYVSVPRAR